jgi:hypothetical protein
MKISLGWIGLRKICVLIVLLVLATAARAGTVTGVIRNGTTNKAAAGVDVILLQLQGGMQTVADTKSDAQGRYQLDNPAIGTQPMLIRAVYRGVYFHQPLTPGTSTADITVYEPTTNPRALQVTVRLLVFQPNGDKLLVGEEYSIKNDSQPPAAFYKQEGTFEFTVPKGATPQQVSAYGPSGMPVTQGTIDKGNGLYAIAYAFQPGDNGVRLSYEVPYDGNQATVRAVSDYDVQRVLLVYPPTMQVASTGFAPAGTEQGFNVSARDTMKAGASFEVSVSGTAPPPDANAAAADQANSRTSGLTVQTAPARLDNEKWILLGGLAAIFAVGVALLLRQPVPAVVSAPAANPQGPRGRKARRMAQAGAKAAHAAPPLTDKVNQEVDRNLDSLKDALLRLELRRQAGTISEEEYARERGRAEEKLRAMVRG